MKSTLELQIRPKKSVFRATSPSLSKQPKPLSFFETCKNTNSDELSNKRRNKIRGTYATCMMALYFLLSRLEVKVKVRGTQKWCMTLHNDDMYEKRFVHETRHKTISFVMLPWTMLCFAARYIWKMNWKNKF